MKHYSIFIILFINTCIYVFKQTLIHSEILYRPTNTSISVKTIFNTNIKVRVFYKTLASTNSIA